MHAGERRRSRRSDVRQPEAGEPADVQETGLPLLEPTDRPHRARTKQGRPPSVDHGLLGRGPCLISDKQKNI